MSALDTIIMCSNEVADRRDAKAELERLRIIEAWVLKWAQHGAGCPYWPPYDGSEKQRPCTCGLAEIMEEMK